MNFNNKITRTVLPIRYIGKDCNNDIWFNNNHTRSETYPMYCMASGWSIRRSNTDEKAKEEEARNKIYGQEDNIFINGHNALEIKGIKVTKTIRYDLFDAIKEFNPRYIITSSEHLSIEGIEVLKTEAVRQYVHYLVPRHSSQDAEFVISEDIYEAVSERYGGTDYHELLEFVNPEIHNPDFFIKVKDKSDKWN